jgi:RNA polymerase sigma-70 factor, ECF subfamily
MMNTTHDGRTMDRDVDLIEALRLGEPGAAEVLVATYGDRAYRLSFRITGNREDAEEAVQDAFWNVTRKIEMFRGDATFGSWIYRIVTNAAYAKLRRRAQRDADIPLDEVLPVFDQDGRHASHLTDWSTRVDDAALQAELRRVLASAIAELPPHYRAAIVLRDVEGESVVDVAHALGITVATAKSRTHRARLRLRQHLATFMAGADMVGADARRTQSAKPARRAAHPNINAHMVA